MSKKNRKRRSMIAVILLIAFLITGCEDKSIKTDHIIRIGVVTYTQDDPFINAMTDQLKENLKKMETDHMKIITTVKNGDDNQQDQNEIVEEMIDAGCDVLCVNLVDRTAPSRIIRMAKQEDIPVLFFNREPVREDLMQWEKLYYIGCNAEQSGIMQGEIVADYIKNHPEVDKNQDGKIQYILLEGEAGHQDAISRTDYSVKTLLEQGINLEKLSYQFADWNRGQAENRMSRLIEQYGDEIELVISNNDEMALGAVAAWQKAGYDCRNWPVIFGIDGLDDALEAIKTGKMKGTVYNDKEDQAMELAKLSVEVAVHPMMIPKEHPLASVRDSFNAVFVRSDAAGDTMFYGRGAGELPTASAIMGDVIDVIRDIQYHCTGRISCTCYRETPVKNFKEVKNKFYIRMLVDNKPGVLAAIASVFGVHKVSIARVIQKTKENDAAELVIVTEAVKEKHLEDALAHLVDMDTTREIGTVIREY